MKRKIKWSLLDSDPETKEARLVVLGDSLALLVDGVNVCEVTEGGFIVPHYTAARAVGLEVSP